MDKDELKSLLLKLHDALQQSPELDPELKGLLDDVDQDLHRLAHEGDEPESEGLSTRLDSVAAEFDAEHPQASGILREVADLLNKMGI